MPQTKEKNRRIVLAARPKGAPVTTDFRLEKAPIPVLQPNQVLLRTVYLSLDPYMRGRMNDGPSYAPPIAIGQVMGGGTVSRVAESNHPDYTQGDWVAAMSGWQDYAASDGTGLRRLGILPHPSWALGVLGMPGFTAYVGLLDIVEPKPGETVVVAGATAIHPSASKFARSRSVRTDRIRAQHDDNSCLY
jgi:NADPH-dependent curcumin reductase